MQITPHHHQLTISFAVPTPAGPLPRTVNFFLHTGPALTLIDSGVAGADIPLWSYLERLGRRPQELAQLLLTHSHPDHLGGGRAVVAASGCRVWAHGAERHWIEDTDRQQRERPVPGFAELVGGPVTLDRLLVDGNRIAAGGGPLTVLHTPGHSAGSVCYWSEEDGVLYCGDALPLPGDLPIFDDYPAAVASLERLRELDCAWLLSAWDRPRQGAEVAAWIEAGLAWLERIAKTVRSEAGAGGDPLALCARVAPRLGLPPAAVNPLVARSFQACLQTL